MDEQHEFPALLGTVARQLFAEPDVQHTVQRVVELAAEHLDGRVAASVHMVRERRRVETPASSDERAARADRLQHELGEGPCLDAIWQQETFQIDDLASETRYPRWARRVVDETGLRSSLSIQLFTDEQTLGALNLYSEQPDSITPEDRSEALIFAAHAAVALRGAQTNEHLRSAVETRTLIGQAQGILMERHDISPSRAFDLLREFSQRRNVKLREVAQQVVENTGQRGSRQSG